MTADLLRQAASLMREHAARGLAWDGDYAADKGWLAPPVAIAVADWLDSAASMGDQSGEPIFDAAVIAALAYLGADS